MTEIHETLFLTTTIITTKNSIIDMTILDFSLADLTSLSQSIHQFLFFIKLYFHLLQHHLYLLDLSFLVQLVSLMVQNIHKPSMNIDKLIKIHFHILFISLNNLFHLILTIITEIPSSLNTRTSTTNPM